MKTKVRKNANKHSLFAKLTSFRVSKFLQNLFSKSQEKTILVPNFRKVDSLLEKIQLEQSRLQRMYVIHIALCQQAEINNQNTVYSFNKVNEQILLIEQLQDQLDKENEVVKQFNTIFENA